MGQTGKILGNGKKSNLQLNSLTAVGIAVTNTT